MKTSTPKPSAPRWLLIDAEGQSLGRIAAQTAMLLRGKCWEGFSPHHLCGDHIVVINVEKLDIPEKKWHRKIYYKHTGHPGHLRSKTLREAFAKSPKFVLESAVKGMLPANRLRPPLLKRFHIYTGSEHPFSAQKPRVTLITGKGLITIQSAV